MNECGSRQVTPQDTGWCRHASDPAPHAPSVPPSLFAHPPASHSHPHPSLTTASSCSLTLGPCGTHQSESSPPPSRRWLDFVAHPFQVMLGHVTALTNHTRAEVARVRPTGTLVKLVPDFQFSASATVRASVTMEVPSGWAFK